MTAKVVYLMSQIVNIDTGVIQRRKLRLIFSKNSNLKLSSVTFLTQGRRGLIYKLIATHINVNRDKKT